MKAHPDWENFIRPELEKPYYIELKNFLKKEMQTKTIYPKTENWFNALSLSPDEVKVIIIGQDPYHGDNQAHGFSFSVQKGVAIPPSLVNIYKEIAREFNIEMSKKNGDLTPWVNQGVMLLNSILTVERNRAASHRGQGWETFTDKIIQTISDNFENKVFMLWGNYAIGKQNLIDKNRHLILTSAHPSPLARGAFDGNGHFLKANEYLKEHNMNPIDWQIKD
jgi:uracil-DNA glycosylase